MNIQKYIEIYRKELKLKNYSDNTIDNYCSQINVFLNKFDNIVPQPSKINEGQIKDYLYFGA
jgi:site-specific recombinase XerD